MKAPIININSKPDWQTYYDPKLVGKYLLWHDKENPFDFEVVTGWKPGMVIPMPPDPNLDGFLRWCASQEKG